MYICKSFHRLLGVLCMFLLGSPIALAQVKLNPNFQGVFERMKENNHFAELYNDSLLMRQNYQQWSTLLKRRYVMLANKYNENQLLIQSLREFFIQNDYEVSPEVYQKFLESFYGQFASVDSVDAFRLLYMCRFLERIGKNIPEKQRAFNLINAWRLHGYVQMWNLGGDVNYLKKAYECGKFVLSDEAKKYPYYDYAFSLSMRYMTKSMWLVFHLQTVSEYREYCRRLDKFLSRPDLDNWMNQGLKSELEHIQGTADEALVRNTYLIGDTAMMGKHEADSLMKVVISRNLANPTLSSLSKIRTLYMQMSLGQITSRMAWKQAMDVYRVIWNRIKGKALDGRQLDEFLQPFYTFFYINYKSDLPIDVKRNTVRELCSNIESAYLNSSGHRDNTNYVRDLLKLSTYDKVTMYLTPDEVKHFLNTLNVATQVGTYAHSVYTTRLAEELTKAVLAYRPSLFVGCLGNESLKDISKNKSQILRFVSESCMYHDIGKNSIVSVVKYGHRPLFPEEEELYRRHPEFALDYLKITPGLSQYSDVALGHHKWYNGEGGYPANFDNTLSPIRFIIDIVALAVSINDEVRNMYAKSSDGLTMTVLMEKLRQGAGTLYNPDLVELIDRNPQLKKKLEYLIGEGRMKTYYGIYSKNFIS